MHVFRSLDEAASNALPSPVVALGIFDGVHRGHQALLAEAGDWAREAGVGSVAVITFDPHPRKVLTGSGPPALFSLEHKLLLLERAGVDAVLVLRFDRSIAALSPEAFVESIVRGALGSRRLLMGFDSAFGRERVGDFAYVREKQSELGIEARQAGILSLGGERVSSTLVREAVLAGDLARFRAITGRDYSVLGRVVEGDRLGRQIGFPTANLDIRARAVIPRGVYFACVDEIARGPGAPRLAAAPALVNVGRRPTLTGESKSASELFDPSHDRFEAHLLDVDLDFYGSQLEAHCFERHRGERQFESLEALTEQIRRDEAAMRAWLAAR